MSKKQADINLVQRLQTGDRNALVDLVKKWHVIFCEKAFWIVKDKELAKDIVQDAWIVISQKVQNLKDPKQFKNWASRIIYNKAIDVLRQQNKQKFVNAELTAESHTHDIDNDRNAEVKKMLLNAIHNLPHSQKEVIQLFYVQNYTLKQISTLLNISVGTAKSRLFHAREKLRITLKSKYYEN